MDEINKKTMFASVAYGEEYCNIFLDYHLKSLLDVTNAPKHADKLTYVLYTDKETLPQIEASENFKTLKRLIKTEVMDIQWPENQDRYNARYPILSSMCKNVVKAAIDGDYDFVTVLPCDIIFAKNYFDRVYEHLDRGHDSVFCHPARGAFETMKPYFDRYTDAFNSEDLFQLTYYNMHPLWVHCHWDSPQFTRMPDTLLWNSGSGLIARTLSITPVIFKPYPEMLKADGVLDISIPPLCKNPYWCEDWSEAPLVGSEPVVSWYGKFFQTSGLVEYVANRESKHNRKGNLKHIIYYPNKRTVSRNAELFEVLVEKSNDVANRIMKYETV